MPRYGVDVTTSGGGCQRPLAPMTRGWAARAAGASRMGTEASKSKSGEWEWSGPPGEHSPFPLDPVPYPGASTFYCFIDVLVAYRFMRNEMNLGPQVVMTNVEQHLEDMKEGYRDGFRLNDFVKVPSVRNTTAVQDWGRPHPYQAILSRPGDSKGAVPGEDWELVVEKAILNTRTFTGDCPEEEQDLVAVINKFAAMNAQLVCVQPVGFVRSASTNTQYGVLGAELFFNVPRHKVPTPPAYVYHTARVPAQYKIRPDATQTIQQVICDTDFMGQLSVFLNCGWKLVDVCMDTAAIAEAYTVRATSKVVESVWIFERDASKMDDDSPQYEGVIIEYLHKVKVGTGGEFPCKDWRPVVAGMGVSGWQLASIIQTPLLVQSSFSSFTMKLLMIFQRPIIPGYEQLKREKLATGSRLKQDGSRADYLRLKSADSDNIQGYFGTLAGGTPVQSYYHGTLGKHIYGQRPPGSPEMGCAGFSSQPVPQPSGSKSPLVLPSRSRSRPGFAVAAASVANGGPASLGNGPRASASADEPPPYWDFRNSPADDHPS